MISYIPFLKAKRGEMTAMSELTPKVKQAICPFFDFPRKKTDYDSAGYANTAYSIATSLKKHWGANDELYFDDLDINQKLKVENEEKYAHVLHALHELKVIPVVGLNRNRHNDSVAQLKRDGEIATPTVALRVVKNDFEAFDLVREQIEYDLGSVFKEFDTIDLILDCRVCTGMDVSTTAQQIATFAQKFSTTYNKVHRVIATGSSIPPSIGELLKVNTSGFLKRQELAIIDKAQDLFDGEVLPGDYASVSPFYSDADLDPKLMQNVMTPRLIYPFNHSHYLSRGSSMKSGGQKQYVGLTKALCSHNFFRPGYSTGDDYFREKSKGIGNNATNGTVVKPSVVAHITYMVLDAKL